MHQPHIPLYVFNMRDEKPLKFTAHRTFSAPPVLRAKGVFAILIRDNHLVLPPPLAAQLKFVNPPERRLGQTPAVLVVFTKALGLDQQTAYCVRVERTGMLQAVEEDDAGLNAAGEKTGIAYDFEGSVRSWVVG